MAYRSFNTEKRKLVKLFNQQEVYEDELSKLERIPVDYRSVNNYKRNKKIFLAQGVRSDTYSLGDLTFEFQNFPDWAIDSLIISHEFYVDDSYNENNFKFTTNNLSVGDIFLPNNDKFKQIWIREDTLNILVLDINKTANLVTSTSPGGGFLSTSIPIYVDVIMIPFNKRDYNELSTRKTKTAKNR